MYHLCHEDFPYHSNLFFLRNFLTLGGVSPRYFHSHYSIELLFPSSIQREHEVTQSPQWTETLSTSTKQHSVSILGKKD